MELLWSSPKKREPANLAGDHLADVADATEQGVRRINTNPQLPWSLLAYTGLTLHPPNPTELTKTSVGRLFLLQHVRGRLERVW
ncbi:hypothetical protein [Streptomyces sp. NPDC088752]|uniref:hypothetical protein n=1 Tax=Streptomyces sp. NPDC088752 TaxID=3154963 RepID=UPI003426B91F